MSNLKWLSDEELVDEIKSIQLRIESMEVEREQAEKRANYFKQQIHNATVRQDWAIEYLKGSV